MRVARWLLIGLSGLFVSVARAADGGATVSGVVRDSQGVAQMGALVQVLAANSATIATAFTDSHGRYLITHITSGRYLVRASASLFVPATRSNLQLRSGAIAVVNLTLAALFDTAQWLPAERRRAGEPDDDWKWTLRSSANRPILRIMEDGALLEVSTSSREPSTAAATTARATVSSGDGEFGAGGVHNILTIHRAMDNGGDLIVRSDIGSNRVPAAFGPSQEFEAGFEQRQGFDGAARTLVSYRVHPELVTAGSTAGLQAFSITSAQRMNLGGLVEVEAGGRLQMVNAGPMSVSTHPFVRVSAHPMGMWTLHYRMATDRGVQGFEGVTTGGNEVPVALVKNGHLAVESGRHQEVAVDRRAGRGTVSAALFHDAIGQAVIAGGGAAGPRETRPSLLPTGMLVDPTTGMFRALTNGYTANGARLTVSTPLLDGLWVAAEYSMGTAIAAGLDPGAAFTDAVASLTPEKSQSATVALKGRLMSSGTRMRASYRWQPAHLVTAIDPYSSFSDQGFLSFQIRQPIHWGMRLPKGLDATIDVTNLLAQGYRPFLSVDGQTLYFAQSPRSIQGGVSFTF
jgi:hypothetical protein